MAAVSQLTVRISAQIADLQKGMAEGTKAVKDFGSSFEGIATRASAVGSFIGNIAADMAKSLISNLGHAFSEAISLSQKFSNAFIGLGSVARAFGSDADSATAAARKLSADGLLPIADAATGLKNLLAAGFSLPEATRLMEAFKDSAAFGRQGALSFGDAVRSATEGVKNGNSILVDNAGVTKNLSQILKEAGFSAQDLSKAATDVNIRMALYNGILKETAAQTGDADRLTQTYTGQVTKLRTQYDNFLATLGNAITQNKTVAVAIGVVSEQFGRLAGWLVKNSNGFNLVSDAVIGFVKVAAGVIRAIDAIQRGFNALDSALNLTVKEISTGLSTVSKTLVSVISVLAKIPGSGIVFSTFSSEITSLIAVQTASVKVTEEMTRRLQANQDRMASWSGTLQGAATKLDGLATSLKSTRGQTVALGEAATGVVPPLNTIGDAAEKNSKKVTKLVEAVTSFKDGLTSLPGQVMKAGLEMPPVLFDSLIPFKGLKEGLQSLPGEVFKIQMPKLSEIGAFMHTIQDQLGRTIMQAFTGGGDLGKSVGGLLGGALFDSTQGLTSLTKGISNALKKGLGGTVGGLLGSILPGIGTILGGLGGGLLDKVFGGLFGGEGKKTAKARDKFIEEFGGLDKLKQVAAEAGFSLDKLLSTKKVKDFENEVRKLNDSVTAHKQAIEEAARQWEGVQIAVTGVNKKAEVFAAPFRAALEALKKTNEEANKIRFGAPGGGDGIFGNTDLLSAEDRRKLDELDGEWDKQKAKLRELANTGQAEFERIGTFVAAAFAGTVKHTGDAIEAIRSLEPAFKVLQEGVDAFGLQSTGTIDSLLTMFRALNDEVSGPLFENLQATGQIFAGLQQGGLLTADLFQVIGTDIGAIFAEMEAKGVDMSVALALSQPILQRLWEAQQIFGEVTDDTTKKILEQAHEQGLVGEHMKDVNKKILDVLIAIADVFGAKLPEALRGLPAAAKDAADGVTRELGRIEVPEITVRAKVDVQGGDVPGFAGGTKGRYLNFGDGTLVMLHGHERVMTPGESEDVGMGGGDIVIQHQTILDGHVIDERIDHVGRQKLATGAWRPRTGAARVY